MVRVDRLDTPILPSTATRSPQWAPGSRADLNVIDFTRLRVTPPRVVYDLPAGGKRLAQGAQGYRHTFVAGSETLCDDRPTGALPGRLLRSAVT
jgi:N-acyl-D-aspartate/D-glutamate deacylase